MTPPISIDGTDITGATIDGTDVQEITVDGQTLFTAEEIVDNFESGNLNAYDANGISGNLSPYTVQSTTVHSGSFALKANTSALGGTRSAIYTENPPGGFNPGFGDDFEVYVYLEPNKDIECRFVWLSDTVDSQGGIPNGFSLEFALGQFADKTVINETRPGSFNFNINKIGDFPPTGVWLRCEITYSGNTINVDVSDGGTTVRSGSLNAVGTGEGNHIAFFASSDGDMFWDDWALL